MKKIIIIGPAYPLRGGLATFNQRLAKEFINDGDDCIIYSFSLQYPSFFFPGKTQYSSDPPPIGLRIVSAINSINPINWIQVGNRIKKERPDLIVVRYWLPFMGPALGTILRRVKKNKHTKIVCIADNIIPHEHRPGDKAFTKYFLKSCNAFITMSAKVMDDLRKFEKDKPAKLVQHPLYDNFGEPVSKTEARQKLKIDTEELIILFFGFIRKYKGLDILLDAMGILKNRIQNSEFRMPKLLIAGECYEDEKPYDEQINKLGIRDNIILRTDFIPDSEVKFYLCSADVVVQPYRNATQSGVTPLAYYFEKPMIVTNVGGLPALVPHEKAGLVAEPNAASIADAIFRFYQLGENYFLPHLRSEKQKYSWGNLVNAIKEI
ncbi:MAG TPA: glycosyltransferase [Chitinophagaceae bacterium]|jgi:glycosyltransferase involved in cell wall biosynthesis|nr:glycosyltransferase [Chitinophagaceae bacterium]